MGLSALMCHAYVRIRCLQLLSFVLFSKISLYCKIRTDIEKTQQLQKNAITQEDPKNADALKTQAMGTLRECENHESEEYRVLTRVQLWKAGYCLTLEPVHEQCCRVLTLKPVHG